MNFHFDAFSTSIAENASFLTILVTFKSSVHRFGELDITIRVLKFSSLYVQLFDKASTDKYLKYRSLWEFDGCNS